MAEYCLSAYDAEVLTPSRTMADYYEAAVAAHGNGKTVANWVSGELFRLLRQHNLEIETSRCPPSR